MKIFSTLTFNLFLISTILISCKSETDNYKSISNEVVSHFEDGYVGDDNCKSCHEKAYESWSGSHHDLAMQEATNETILGDFNNHKISIDGVDYHFYKKENEFYADVKEIDGSEMTYQIKYAFGITPLQQYMTDFSRGRKQVLRATWDTIENKWFHQYKDDRIETDDWLHWTNGGQNWNTMCAECHSTNLKKNYNVEKDSFHTTYSYINVSCETCHGPGEKHLKWADEGEKPGDMYTLNDIDQTSIMNQCAPCHARRVKLTEVLEPGADFYDQFMVQTLTTDFYYPDGQILEEDYVFASFLQSKMYMQGIRCNDCHDAHSMELKLEGNKLCLQCHVPAKYDSKEHHFHEENTEASQCINCHMTGRYYMGNDFRRDHSFRIPRPDQSIEYDTPNACKGCHDDKSNKWSADYIVKWYGPSRVDHFSDHMLLSSKDELSKKELEQINAFILDTKYPYLTRATAIENIVITDNSQFETLLKALKDSSALVRYKALQKFRDIPVEQRASLAVDMVNDASKLVRIGAAQILIDFDINTLPESNRVLLQNARNELEAMLYANADFSVGRLNLGDYYIQNNDIKTGIEHYKKAIEKDSLLYIVYPNLATAYSMVGDNENALKVLNKLIEENPDNARAYYLRALLYFEMNNELDAIANFKIAIEKDPNNSRSYYNLATYYYQNKKFDIAEKYIKDGLKIEPRNNDFKYLLALIYRDQGKIQASQKIMQELQNTPR